MSEKQRAHSAQFCVSNLKKKKYLLRSGTNKKKRYVHVAAACMNESNALSIPIRLIKYNINCNKLT